MEGVGWWGWVGGVGWGWVGGWVGWVGVENVVWNGWDGIGFVAVPEPGHCTNGKSKLI